jgi:hypothetical protein
MLGKPLGRQRVRRREIGMSFGHTELVSSRVTARLLASPEAMSEWTASSR